MRSWPAAISGNGPGARASKCSRAFCAWRRLASSCGNGGQRAEILGLRACCTSSSDSLPLLNSRSVISRLRFCSAAFSRAITQPRLQGADRAVEARHLRGHQHLQVVVLGDAGEVAGIRGLDAAPELAPEIELPADLEPATPFQKPRSGPSRRSVLADAEHSPRRPAAPAGSSVLPAMPSWARASMMRRPAVRTFGIHALRLGHQLLEHRVVEVAPPLVALHRRPPGVLRLRFRRPERVGGPGSSHGTSGRSKSGPSVTHEVSRTERARGARASARTSAGRPASIQSARDAPPAGCARGPSGFVATHHMKIW